MTFVMQGINEWVVTSGRRNCSKCKRWRHISDFSVKKWEFGEMRHLQSACRVCVRQAEAIVLADPDRRLRRQEMARMSEERARRAAGISPRCFSDGRNDDLADALPVEPFRAWLNEQVQANSITGVASCIGVSARRITTILDGSYVKDERRYEIKNVAVSTVDTWMTQFGQHYKEIYPDA